MRVTVDTSNRDGSRMPTTNKTLFKYKTTVFTDQLAKVDALIDSILKANSPDMSLPKADKHD
jgi:membrane fusion protein (multidrug efflux system)